MVCGYCANIEFIFPTAYSGALYLQVDLSFVMPYTQAITCQVNSVVYVCLRVAPNLVQIASTAALAAGATNTLMACGLNPTTKDIIDELITFKLFTTSGQSVAVGSHDHRVSTLLLSDLINYPSTLQQWSYNSNSSWIYHVVYIGYYGKSVQLSTIGVSPYSQNILQNYSSVGAVSYLNSSTLVEMGSTYHILDLAASSYSHAAWVDYLSFTTSAIAYAAAPDLPIYVSDAQCVIELEYASYTIYTGGITLPIWLDFSECRPAAAHVLSYSINSPYLAIDTALTTTILNASHYKAYIVVRQIPSFTFSGAFTLQTTLSGPYNASFSTIPAVTIQVSASTILQIPQSQLPTINQVHLTSYIVE